MCIRDRINTERGRRHRDGAPPPRPGALGLLEAGGPSGSWAPRAPGGRGLLGDWRSERKVGSGGSKRNTTKTAPRPHTSPAWHPPVPAVAGRPPQMRKQASWGPCVACRPQGPREASKPHGRIAHSQHPWRPLARQWTYSPRARPQVGLQAPSPARLPGCAATPSALLGPRWAAAQRRVSVLRDGQATDLAVSLCLGITRRPRLPQHRPQ